jgi:translation initiation factor IF-2
MVKKRVHELAKELNIESKEIIKKLTSLGVSVKTHMSALEEQDIQRLIEAIKTERAKGEEAKAVRTAQPMPTQTAPAKKIQDQKINEHGENKQPEPAGGKTAEKRTAGTGRSKNLKGKGYDRGPGLVDRVPSRPPDKRFQERPFLKGDNLPGGFKKSGLSAQAGSKTAEATPSERSNETQRSNETRPFETKQQSKEQTPREFSRRPQPAHQMRQTPVKPITGREQTTSAQTTTKKPVSGKEQPKSFGQLKVPKVPEEIKAQIQEKVKIREKGRPVEKERDRRQAQERELRSAYATKPKGSAHQKEKEKIAPLEKKPIVVKETITVQDLANKTKTSPAEMIKKLMSLGVMATINQEIDYETATIVANEFGYEVQLKPEIDEEAILTQEQEDDPSKLVQRPGVVTIMGHVDHGKTSLLDAIRKTNVTATEVGGITQHIGAYQIEYNDKKITFIDTPGHEAFTAMRARGASITDIAVLVVAADDGVMPQTIEAINHAKAANIPIIVAINKMDKPGANPDRIKQQLTEHGLVAEEWGGQTICVPVSAKTGQGLNDLLEMILLVAEMSDLKANPERTARGTIIEAELDKGRGPVATVLVQNGTLNVGDSLLAGIAAGRIKAMTDYTGKRVKSAGPSSAVEVLGFSDVPQAGDSLYVVSDEKSARHIAAKRILRKREEEIKTRAPRISLDDFFNKIKEGQAKELNLILKADVQGSVEALSQSLQALSTDEVRVNIIHSGVGLISETDILLASASEAIIIGFNVRPDVNARRASEAEKIDIRLYRVIYDAINDIKAAMSGLLEPEYREVVIGQAEIRKIFKVSKIGTIGGCYIKQGKITRDAKVKLIRDGEIIHEGKLDSLKRFKDDVKEVQEGYECGLSLKDYNDIKEGDLIEAVVTETIKRELA